MSERRNMKISGTGTIPGGLYNEISVSGVGSIDGDCDANKISVSGKASIDGKLDSDLIKVSGTSTFNGSVKSKEMKISGNILAKNDIESDTINVSGRFISEGYILCKDMTVSGTLKCDEDIKSSKINIYGTINASNIESETFLSRGSIKIAGMLNSEFIDIAIMNKSEIGEIGGKNIKIVGGNKGMVIARLRSLFSGEQGMLKLNTKSIEGDEIFLENIRVSDVCGQNVTIGKFCTVDKVTYTSTLNISEGSIVKEVVKL